MNTLHAPTTELAAQWLDDLGIDYYTCEHCTGLHLTGLPTLDGLLESRLFVEEWGLLLSSEFQIRPSALLHLTAELGSLNGNFPTLKLFLDIVDDGVPQLVVGTTVLTGAGLSEGQFGLFVTSNLEMIGQLAADLEQMECLLRGEMEGGHQLH